MSVQFSVRSTVVLLVALWSCGVCSCAHREPLFQAKAQVAPKVRYCFDAIGHISGSKPWILGGTCCCTPTEKQFTQYQSDGFCAEVTYPEFVSLYERRGIKTGLDHKGCNNACRFGPHVLKGGNCMASPTVGTTNYEEVFSGTRLVAAATERPKRKGR